jgi:hypothetical protein
MLQLLKNILKDWMEKLKYEITRTLVEYFKFINYYYFNKHVNNDLNIVGQSVYNRNFAKFIKLHDKKVGDA